MEQIWSIPGISSGSSTSVEDIRSTPPIQKQTRYDLRDTPARQAAASRFSTPPPSSYNWGSAASYELLDVLLGQGAYGSVFQARDLGTGTTVAAKVVPTHKQQPAQVHQEVALMHWLAHPNIITVLCPAQELGLVLGQPHSMAIYLELCTTDLFARVKQAGSLPEAEARACVSQLMAAVDHMHAHGVCHRDLKLENILLDAHGVCKVTDFGLSITLQRHSTADERWLHQICGSKSYCAPEILDGLGYDAFSADVWSCGICTFAMLAGFFPLDQAADTDWRFERLKLSLMARCSLTHTVFGFYERACPLSLEACDTIDGMLALLPGSRLSAASVLRMPWLQGGGGGDGMSVDDIGEASVAPAYRRNQAPTMDGDKLSAILAEYSSAPEHLVRPYYRSGSNKLGRLPPELERQSPFLGETAEEPGAWQMLSEASSRAYAAAAGWFAQYLGGWLEQKGERG